MWTLAHSAVGGSRKSAGSTAAGARRGRRADRGTGPRTVGSGRRAVCDELPAAVDIDVELVGQLAQDLLRSGPRQLDQRLGETSPRRGVRGGRDEFVDQCGHDRCCLPTPARPGQSRKTAGQSRFRSGLQNRHALHVVRHRKTCHRMRRRENQQVRGRTKSPPRPCTGSSIDGVRQGGTSSAQNCCCLAPGGRKQGVETESRRVPGGFTESAMSE